MTYSLNTLNASDAERPAPTGLPRFLREVTLVGGFCALAFWLMAMLSYAPTDPAWTSSGSSFLTPSITARVDTPPVLRTIISAPGRPSTATELVCT